MILLQLFPPAEGVSLSCRSTELGSPTYTSYTDLSRHGSSARFSVDGSSSNGCPSNVTGSSTDQPEDQPEDEDCEVMDVESCPAACREELPVEVVTCVLEHPELSCDGLVQACLDTGSPTPPPTEERSRDAGVPSE